MNIAETGQKIDRLIHNISERDRVLAEMYFDSVPKDVSFKKYDENGELKTITMPNRAKMQSDFESWKTNARAEHPITPNLIRDTKRFRGLCDGALNTKKNWNQGGLGGVWGGFLYNGCVGSATIEVVDLGNYNTAQTKGITPYAELASLVGENGYGVDVCATIIDISITNSGGGFYMFCQDCKSATSWNVGDWITQTSMFAIVLAHNGTIGGSFFSNRGAGIGIGKEALNKGWKHYCSVKRGFGGCEQSFFGGIGTMKLAIALPYESYGNNGGTPIWAGHMGHYQSNDTI